ncbi:MAG: hypothetical protein ACREPI_10890, partial [Candidatus Dormibacterales bacterium]
RTARGRRPSALGWGASPWAHAHGFATSLLESGMAESVRIYLGVVARSELRGSVRRPPAWVMSGPGPELPPSA